MTSSSKDLISIIVPVYNAQDFLRECIDSILAQTHKNIELILINDASKDGSSKICDAYANQDKRVKVIHRKENGGQSAARNTGLKQAKGEWIAFCDCDDTYEPNMLEVLYKNAVENNVLVSGCAHNVINGESSYVVGPDRLRPGINYTYQYIVNTLIRPGDAWIDVWTKLYNRSLLPMLEFPKGMQLEDYYVNLFILYQIKEIYFCQTPLYNWVRRTSSQGVEKFSSNMLSIYKASQLIREKFEKINAPADIVQASKVFEFTAKVDVLWKAAKSGNEELRNFATERYNDVVKLKKDVKKVLSIKSYAHCLIKLYKVKQL